MFNIFIYEKNHNGLHLETELYFVLGSIVYIWGFSKPIVKTYTFV